MSSEQPSDKILVVDDRVAFCGGSDFEANRWDTPAHRDRDARRRLPSGEAYPPRHDVMLAVDGAAARALAALARTGPDRLVEVEPELPRFETVQPGAATDGGVAVACQVAILHGVFLIDRAGGAHAAWSPTNTGPSSTGRMCSGRVVWRLRAMSA